MTGFFVARFDCDLPDSRSNREPLHASCDVLESHEGLCSSLLSGTLRQGSILDILILHPGNPGVVHFYEDFLIELAQRLPHCGVVILGFAGHTLDDRCNAAVFDLQAQIDVSSKFWSATEKSILRLRRVFVAGHSIGAYIALHAAARHPHISRAFLLAPTITNMESSPNGRRNRWILNAPFAIDILSNLCVPLLRSLPTPVKRLAIRLAEPSMHARHLSIVLQLAQPQLVRNVLHLAKSEFAQIRDLDRPLLTELAGRLRFYFVHNDGWVPFSDVGRIGGIVSASLIEIEHNRHVQHAWCCGSSGIVAERVSAYINEIH